MIASADLATTEPARRDSLFTRHPVTAGFVLMFALTWPLELGLAAQSRGWLPFHFPPALELFVGYGFVTAALIMSGTVDGMTGIVTLLKGLLIWRVGWLWYGVALFGPAITYLLGIAIHVLLGGATPDFGQPFVARLVPPSFNIGLAAILFLLYQVFVNGEEFGWRGYAQPRLQARHSSLGASLIIGVVWALWHVPKYLTVGDPHDTSFWFFAVNMVANAIFYAWMFNKTGGSLLLMLLLHAGINTGMVLLPIMPAVAGDTRPLVIAYGLQNIVAILLVHFSGVNLGRKPELSYP